MSKRRIYDVILASFNNNNDIMRSLNCNTWLNTTLISVDSII